MNRIKFLIACEESQAVTIALRKLGIEAYSCDILPCSGGHPEWHIQDDVLQVITKDTWTAMIAFPPCTHLAVSGAAWFEKKRKDGRQQQGIDFFMQIVNAPIKYKAIENPVGIMSKLYRKPDQLIQPYYFGDEAQKTTCLWLFNLPPLYHNPEPNLFDETVTHVFRGEMHEWIDGKTGKVKRQPKWYADLFLKSGTANIGHSRSKTFPGIANAMAKHWGEYVVSKNLLPE